MIDKHGMMVKLLPTWLTHRQHTPETCAKVLGLGPEAAAEIDAMVLMGRAAARELNVLCSAFMSENATIEREQDSVTHPITPKAQHSRHIGTKDAA